MRHFRFTLIVSLLYALISCSEEPQVTPSDSTAPEVTEVIPANNSTDISIHTLITVTFSEEIDSASVNTNSYVLNSDGSQVPGTIEVNSNKAIFNPDDPLDYETIFTAKVTQVIRDIAGNNIKEDYVWSFTTEKDITPIDLIRPTVISLFPEHNAQNIPVNTVITATFSEPVQNIDESNFRVGKNSIFNRIDGVVTYSGVTATFTPSEPLSGNTYYQARLDTSIRDLSGNRLVHIYDWVFTTEATPWTLLDEKYEIYYLDFDELGNAYVGGVYDVYPSDQFGFYAKFNADGTFAWLREPETENGNKARNITSIKAFNGFVYVGWSLGSIPPIVHLLKANADNGNKAWDVLDPQIAAIQRIQGYSNLIFTATLRGPTPILRRYNDIDGSFAGDIEPPEVWDYTITDNNIYCTGWMYSTPSHDIKTSSLTHNGVIQWENNWGTELHDYRTEVIYYNNNIYCIGGTTTPFQPYMIKYDNSGNLISDTIYTNLYVGTGFVEDAIVDQNGDFYFVDGPIKLAENGDVIWNSGDMVGNNLRERNGILYVTPSYPYPKHKLILYDAATGSRIN